MHVIACVCVWFNRYTGYRGWMMSHIDRLVTASDRSHEPGSSASIHALEPARAVRAPMNFFSPAFLKVFSTRLPVIAKATCMPRMRKSFTTSLMTWQAVESTLITGVLGGSSWTQAIPTQAIEELRTVSDSLCKGMALDTYSTSRSASKGNITNLSRRFALGE